MSPACVTASKDCKMSLGKGYEKEALDVLHSNSPIRSQEDALSL